MIRKICLSLCLLIFCLNPVYSRDLSEVLDSIVPSLQQVRQLQGLQISVFRPGRILTRTYGVKGPDRSSITKNTNFQAGELIQPVIAEIAREHGCKLQSDCNPALNLYIEKTFHVKVDYEIKLLDLISMTAGLQASHRGLLSPDQGSVEKLELLKESIQFDHRPGVAFVASSESYEILYEWLQSEGVDVPDQIARKTGGSIQKPKSFSLSDGFTSDKHWPVEAPSIRTVYDSYHSLYTSSESYAKWLIQASKKKHAGQPFLSRLFSYHEQLGGVGPGFHAMRLCEASTIPYVFIKHGKPPGFRSVAVVSPDSRGMVILTNSEDSKVIATIMQRVFRDLFPECPDIFAYNDTIKHSTRESLSDFEGLYRPLYTLPAEQSFFRFMLDNRLRQNDAGEIEFAGFFEKEPSIFLKRDDEETYRAVGLAQMAGTRIRFQKNKSNDSVIMQTDLAVYEKISLMQSIWGRIVLLSSGIVIIFLVILVWLIRRARIQD